MKRFLVIGVVLAVGAASWAQSGSATLKVTSAGNTDKGQGLVKVQPTRADGGFARSLAPADFAVKVDGQLAKTLSATQGRDESTKLSVVLAIDTSLSMRRSFAQVTQSASDFAKGLQANDSVAVIGFDQKPKTACEFTTDKAKAAAALKALKPAGESTCLYDALDESFRLQKDAPPGSKAIVLLTDGKDTSSAMTREDIVNKARTSNVPVYTIALGSSADQQVLERIARNSGGKAFTAQGEGGVAVYKDIANSVGQEYRLTVDKPIAGAGHKVDVDWLDNGKTLASGSITTTGATSSGGGAVSATNQVQSKTEFWKSPFFLGGIVALASVIVIALTLRQRKPEVGKETYYPPAPVPNVQLGNTISSVPMMRDEDADETLTSPGFRERPEPMRGSAGPVSMEKGATIIRNAPVAKPLAWLVVMSGPNKGRDFRISGESIIGRNMSCEVSISEDEAMSARHAKLSVEPGGHFRLTDMASTNGTIVNGERVTQVPIKDGDTIVLGDTTFRFKTIDEPSETL